MHYNIIKEIFQIIIKNPKKLKQILPKPQEKYKEYVKNNYSINQLPTIELLDLCPNFNEEINCYSFLEGSSLISDIAILKCLAKHFPNCKYLEIGSWRGESLFNVAEVAEFCTSISLSKEEMEQRGFSKSFIDVHGIFTKGLDNIIQIGHDSTTFDFSKLGKFDLIFIDGNHSYEAIKKDTENAYKLLKNNNSVIIWHDYSFELESVRYETLAAILDGSLSKNIGNLYHISNSKCVIYTKKKYHTKYIRYDGQVPTTNFRIKIKAEIFLNNL